MKIFYTSSKFTNLKKLVYFNSFLYVVFLHFFIIYKYIIYENLQPVVEFFFNFDRSILKPIIGLIIIIFMFFGIKEFFLQLSDNEIYYLIFSTYGRIQFFDIIFKVAFSSAFMVLPVIMFITMKYVSSLMADILLYILILISFMLLILLLGLFFLLIKDSEKLIKKRGFDKKIIDFKKFDIKELLDFILK